MKKFFHILLYFSCFSFSLHAATPEERAFKAFESMKWLQATSLYYEILRGDTPLSSGEQYGRAIIAATQAIDSAKTFFFIRKLNEHTDYTKNYVACIEQALEMDKRQKLYEPVLLFICNNSKKECEAIQNYVLEKYNKEDKYKEAHRIMNSLLSNNPGNNQLLYSIAQLEMLLGNSNNAILYARQILVNKPKDLDANLFLGNLYLRKSELQIDSLKTTLKPKRSSLKKGDIISYQLSLNEIIRTNLNMADHFLNRANEIKSNHYIRENLNLIAKIREDNTKAMLRLKLIDVETLLP
ncbi:MAG: tetratricopeptide repeat protein [Bacteroidales bacterium]